MRFKIKRPPGNFFLPDPDSHYCSRYLYYPSMWDEIIEDNIIINGIPALSKAFGNYVFIYKTKAYWIFTEWLDFNFLEFPENENLFNFLAKEYIENETI